jgi:hypothetical protein
VRLVVLVALAFARVANADDLATARALEAKLEYEQALKIVEGVLANGGADPARYVELHLLAGRLAGGLDRPEVAREHFARVLALRPTTLLPDGTSPKLTEPFAAAKARTTPLIVKANARRGLVSIEATDALGIVSGIAVHAVVAGEHADLVERGARRIVVPDDAQVIEVAALDASGNRVWVGAPERETVIAAASGDRPIYAQWPLYAGLGGVALVGATLAAWRFSVAQDDWNRLDAQPGSEFSDLEALERRGKRWGLAANVSFGVAAISGVVAVIVGVRSRNDRDVSISPTSQGVAIFGRF